MDNQKKHKKNKITKEEIKKRIFPTVIFSLLIPLMICVSIPFEIYANNLDEFLFSVSSFLPMLLLLLFIIFSVIFFSVLFLPRKAYRIVVSIIIALSLMFFVQGTYLNANSNMLAGDNLGSVDESMGMKILNLLIWIAVVVVAIVLAVIKDKRGIVPIIAIISSIVVISTQIMTPMSIVLTNNKVFLNIDERLDAMGVDSNHSILTDENLFTFSNTNNIFYFCVDRFDEDFAEDAYNKYEGIYDKLTGFTWFQDNISVYGHTYPAVVQMLTGVDYNIEEKRVDYFNRAYEENKTLSVLSENGYEINLHTQD